MDMCKLPTGTEEIRSVEGIARGHQDVIDQQALTAAVATGSEENLIIMKAVHVVVILNEGSR